MIVDMILRRMSTQYLGYLFLRRSICGGAVVMRCQRVHATGIAKLAVVVMMLKAMITVVLRHKP